MEGRYIYVAFYRGAEELRDCMVAFLLLDVMSLLFVFFLIPDRYPNIKCSCAL